MESVFFYILTRWLVNEKQFVVTLASVLSFFHLITLLKMTLTHAKKSLRNKKNGLELSLEPVSGRFFINLVI